LMLLKQIGNEKCVTLISKIYIAHLHVIILIAS
jgi:hypothetical protein